MPEIQKEVFCRIGKDGTSGGIFIRSLRSLDRDIALLACQELGMRPEDLHTKTCGIKKGRDVKSVTGDEYLAEKVLKLKFKIVLEECRLVDDTDQTSTKKR